jgi:N-acetylmuramoyl-L-alanine amidase
VGGCGTDSKPAKKDVVGLEPSSGDLARARHAARLRAARERARRHARGRAVGLRPPIERTPIPFPAKRKEEMAAYAQRHYGLDTYRLSDPKVIVEHYTESADAQSAINLFSSDVPDTELHELPNVCAHFVIDRDGTIYELVHLGIMCRHTVGLNYTSFGIEHVGMSDGDVLGDRRQLQASLRLTRWLRCRYGIAVKNVIGHNESLSSPYHHERVARLRTQTHGDMTRASMQKYRARLRRLSCG